MNHHTKSISSKSEQLETKLNRKSLKTCASMAILAIAMSACASKQPSINYTYVKADSNLSKTTDNDAQNQLVEAANSVSQSLQQLSTIQQATHPQVKLQNKKFKAVELTHIASINWDGPVEPALNTVSKYIDYKVRILGRKPSMPLIISLHASNQPIATILRNINYQLTLNNSGSIVIYPETRVIELRYT